jgi:osmotically-inducible protein OsmY
MADPKQLFLRGTGIARSAARRLSRAGRAGVSFVTGKARAAANRHPAPKDLDDRTLKAKVESEIFRPEDAPKSSVDVLVVDGVVELRGEVKRPEDKKKLETDARAIPEVRGVKNLLHLPKVPAPGRADSPGRQKRRS